MKIYVFEEGATPCNADCPFYEESGVVQGYGGPLRSHCKAVMQDVQADCRKYNMRRIYKAVRVTPEAWQKILKLGVAKFVRQRKLYSAEHRPIHPVGWKKYEVRSKK